MYNDTTHTISILRYNHTKTYADLYASVFFQSILKDASLVLQFICSERLIGNNKETIDKLVLIPVLM